VVAALTGAKVTVPGPLVRDQVMVRAGGVGRPSSVTVPFSVSVEGSVTVRSGPAFTTGAWLTTAALTMTCTSSNADSAASLAVGRRLYVPAVGTSAVVVAALAGAKVTVPGPLVRVQVMVSAGGAGKPSSVTVPFSVAVDGSVTVRSGPAFTTGGWLT